MTNKIGEEESEVWLPLSDMLLALILLMVTAGTGLFLTAGLFHLRPTGETKTEKTTTTQTQQGEQGEQKRAGINVGYVIPGNALNFKAPYYKFQEQESRFEDVSADPKLCKPYLAGDKAFKEKIKIKMDLSKKDTASHSQIISFIRDKLNAVKEKRDGLEIAEIRVEAQASPGWGNASPSESAMCNMSLSMLRAWKIYEMIMNMSDWTTDERAFLQQRLVPHPAGATLAIRNAASADKGGAKKQEPEDYRSVSVRVVYTDGSDTTL